MKQPLIPRSPRFGRERGVTMVLVAIAMVAIIAMAAISIDVITLYLAREEAQRSADTAALAAARVISLSGITGDPANTTSSWQAICGGTSSPATLTGTAVALENVVGGAAANTATVTYGGTTASDCSTLISSPAGTFSVNPTVTVKVQRTNLPNFFSRIWTRSGTNVSASATAEVFNSSASNVGTSSVVPVQPACVKPWFVPNYDPLNPLNPANPNCTTNCQPFVSLSNGSIQNPGISLNGGNPTTTGVIGENFWLAANCKIGGSGCILRTGTLPIQANLNNDGVVPGPPPPANRNLLYYPGQAPAVTPAAVPGCSSAGNLYEQTIAGCDQSTVYQCGVPLGNTLDLSENPSTQNGDTAQGVQCLIHQGSTSGGVGGGLGEGQDSLNDSLFPFQIQAGSSNPLVLNAGLPSGSTITASNSIVSLPIYDQTTSNAVVPGGTSQVTVVGFLQVFINNVDEWDNINVTVLNLTGCGNGSPPVASNPVAGTSPVPIRLITPP